MGSPRPGRSRLGTPSVRYAVAAVGVTLTGTVLLLPHSPPSAVRTPPATSAPVPLAATPSRSVAGWESLFLQHWQSDHTRIYLPLSKSKDSWDYYSLVFGVDANTSMFRATGKTEYLDRALLYVENVVASARPSNSFATSEFHDSYLGWVSQRADVKGEEVPLFESFLWRYVTDLLWTIKTSPTVAGNPAYRSRYDRLLQFTEKNMWDKWYSRGASPYMYRVNTHLASHWAFIATQIAQLTADPIRRGQAQAVANNIAHKMPAYGGASLRGQLRLGTDAPGAYFWSATWNSLQDDEDVDHANGVIAYVVAAYGMKREWTSADIAAFTKTLTSVIWRPNGTYALNVGGSGKGDGTIFDGFMKLGRYDGALQRRLESFTGSILDNRGGVSDFYAQGALNAKFLGR